MAAANLTAKEVARVLLLRVVTGDLVLRASRYLGASGHRGCRDYTKERKHFMRLMRMSGRR